MKGLIAKMSIVLVIAISMISATTVLAPVESVFAKVTECEDRRLLGLPFWHEYLSDYNCEIQDIGAYGWSNAVGAVAVAVLEIMLRIAGMVAVGFIIYGGFRYITSQGEPDATKAARETILNAIIGLIIAMIATGVVNFVAKRLTG